MSAFGANQKREEAAEAARKIPRKIERVAYRVENDDVTILSGQYMGHTVRDLFAQGPIERDYIVKKLWFTGDPKVIKVINTMVCN